MTRRNKRKKSKPIKISERKKEYYKYLRSPEWVKKKEEFYRFLLAAKLPKECDLCGSKTCLSVHHMTYENVFNEDMYDLQLICKKCHELEHAKKSGAVIKKNGITIIPWVAKTF